MPEGTQLVLRDGHCYGWATLCSSVSRQPYLPTPLPVSLATSALATYLSCSQGHKIIHCFWNRFSKETDDHPAYIFISNSQVKVHLRKKTISNLAS